VLLRLHACLNQESSPNVTTYPDCFCCFSFCLLICFVFLCVFVFAFQSQESERTVISALGYRLNHCFYDLSIRFRNCSDSGMFALHFLCSGGQYHNHRIRYTFYETNTHRKTKQISKQKEKQQKQSGYVVTFGLLSWFKQACNRSSTIQ
jgi:hypothetical protein